MDAGWDETDSDGEADIPDASAAAQALSAWFNEGECVQPCLPSTHCFRNSSQSTVACLLVCGQCNGVLSRLACRLDVLPSTNNLQ